YRPRRGAFNRRDDRPACRGHHPRSAAAIRRASDHRRRAPTPDEAGRMINFRAIAQLDTFAVTAQLFKLRPKEWKPVEARGELNNSSFGLGASLLLRAHSPITKENWLEDLPVRSTRDLEQWKTMQQLLEKALRAIMAESLARQYLDGEM